MEYQNYDDFITKLKALGDKDKQIEAIGQYFLDNVEYDYVVHDVMKSTCHRDGIDKIDDAFDASDLEQKTKALEELKKLGFSDGYISRISAEYGKQFVIPARPARGIVPATEEQVKIRNLWMASNLIRCDEHTDIRHQNGLLTKGVCRHYTPFIDKVCADLGIPSVAVHGDTSGGHVWNKIKGNDGKAKHYDPTYAIYIRDGYKYDGYKGHEKESDWFGIDDKKLFELQPIRKIKKIGDKDVQIDANTINKTGEKEA